MKRQLYRAYNQSTSKLNDANISLMDSESVGLHSKSTEQASLCASVNRQIHMALSNVNCATGRKRRRGTYERYDEEQRAKIARYAVENGNTRAARHFSTLLGKCISEGSVRNMKRAYVQLKKSAGEEEIVVLPKGKLGRPLMLEAFEPAIIERLKAVRETGGVINRLIVIATAKGVVCHRDKGLLREHGGTIDITKGWANSILSRIGFVKRKDTKYAGNVPTDFEKLKTVFLQSITKIVVDDHIPPEMIVNFDQTGIKIIPVSNSTLAEHGSKQVANIGLEDTRQITAVVGCAMDGTLVPPQLLYQGSTDRCHPKFHFPEEWDVHHTPNRWPNAESMERYIEKVIDPYFETTRERLGLPDDQPGLLIFDVFKSHGQESFLKKIKSINSRYVFVPASCTEDLQPLYLSGNSELKAYLKQLFTDWYAQRVERETTVDLRLSKLKPLHAKWLLQSFNQLRENGDSLRCGWVKSGIAGAVNYKYTIDGL